MSFPQKSSLPFVSVITPLLDTEHTTIFSSFRKLQQSLARQTYGRTHIEHIVIDMRTVSHKKPRICPQDQWIMLSGASLYEGYNQGITHAKGQYLCFLPCNSYFYHHTVKIFVQTIQKFHADYSYGPSILRTRRNSFQLQRLKPLEFIYISTPFPLSAMCITAQCLKSIGSFDTSLSQAADYDFLFRLYRQKKRGIPFFPKTVVHPPIESTPQMRQEEALVRTKYYFSRVPPTLLNDTTALASPEYLRTLMYSLEEGLELAPLVSYFSRITTPPAPINWQFIYEKLKKGFKLLGYILFNRQIFYDREEPKKKTPLPR